MSSYWWVVSYYADGDRILEDHFETEAEAERAAASIRRFREDQDEMPRVVVEEYS